MPTTTTEIATERNGYILDVSFNRPTKKNALSSSMYTTLADVLHEADENNEVRVVLLHGQGDSFTAGNDLEDFMKNPPPASGSPQESLMRAFVDFDKPVVAAVHGAAIGAGVTILPHCDFVYAASSARVQRPFVNLAVVPEFGSSLTIPTQLGYLAAAELILLGQSFDAQQAAELGLVTRVVPDALFLVEARNTAEKLSEKPPAALRACKRLMKRALREQFTVAAAAENDEFSFRVRSPEAKEAIAAFFEKRRPNFN